MFIPNIILFDDDIEDAAISMWSYGHTSLFEDQSESTKNEYRGMAELALLSFIDGKPVIAPDE